MPNRFQFRRDTAANWTSNNPVLAAGEPGYETDTGYIKIGTGAATWTSLDYLEVPPKIVNDGSATFTLDLTHGNAVVRTTSGSAQALTVPQESSVNYPVGTEISIRQAGAGALTVTTTGLTINGTIPTFSQYTETKLRKVGSDEWDVVY